MDFDLFSGFSTYLKKPAQPLPINPPDATKIFQHTGEDEGQYQSFIAAISDLAQAFKFLPKYDQMRYEYGDPLSLLSKNDSAITDYINSMLSDAGSGPFALDDGNSYSPSDIQTQLSVYLDYQASFEDRAAAGKILEAFSKYFFANDTVSKQASPANPDVAWGWGDGTAYSNLDFSPDASDTDLTDGVSTGNVQSFYDIAESGISGYTDEQAYNLMCSMETSKEDVLRALTNIFGAPDGLTDNNAVITNITKWLSQFTTIDPHNLGILDMFFGMQTDLADTLDAFVNCQTYWGGDLTAPGSSTCVSSTVLGTFSDTLRSKVDSYISSLSDDNQKASAESLESKWFAQTPRYDKVGDQWTGDLVGTDGDITTNTSGSWVESFCDKIAQYNTADIGRTFSTLLMNSYEAQKYKTDKADYDQKKDDLMQEEIFLQKMQAKQFAQTRATLKKLLARKPKTSVAAKRAPGVVHRAPVSAKSAPRVAVHPRPPVVSSSAVRNAQSSAIAAGLARRNAQAAAVAPLVSSIAAQAAGHSTQAKKQKDEKKVI